MVATATSSALVRAARVATVIAPDQLAGSISNPRSIGVPIRLVSLAARPGCSRSALAYRRSSRSLDGSVKDRSSGTAQPTLSAAYHCASRRPDAIDTPELAPDLEK